MAGLLVANRSFVCTHEGKRVVVKAGTTRVAADHPIVQGREDLFTEAQIDAMVEDTADRPTRSRGRGRGRKAEDDKAASDSTGDDENSKSEDSKSKGTEDDKAPTDSKSSTSAPSRGKSDAATAKKDD